MTDIETLDERLRSVERAVTDGDHELPAATDLAELAERIAAVEETVATLEDRTAELEAATQALRGYVGNVRSVNERVEQRADAALAATDRLARRLDETGDYPRTEGSRADGRGRQERSAEATPDRSPDDRTARGGPSRADDQAVEPEPTRTQSSADRLGPPDGERRVDGLGSDERTPAEPAAATSSGDQGDAGVLERVRALL